MTSSNIATVIGPALTEASNLALLINNFGFINLVLEKLIVNYEFIFENRPRHRIERRGSGGEGESKEKKVNEDEVGDDGDVERDDVERQDVVVPVPPSAPSAVDSDEEADRKREAVAEEKDRIIKVRRSVERRDEKHDE